MSEFTTYYPEAVNLAPHKRVNYVHGLVLGVDEFLQEELYLLEKHRRHHRGFHGYGTVYGLAVNIEDTAEGQRITVDAGLAVSPQGQEICVAKAQCALLNQWLLQNRQSIEDAFGSPPGGPISLYLVLCYRQCKTDRVPIPSGPCQSLEETTAPSRVADNFELKLTIAAPDHMETEETSAFFDLMRKIAISDASPGLTKTQLHDLVRSLAGPLSPPAPESPPGGYTLHPDNARDYLQSACRVWVTEVRPKVMDHAGGCASDARQEGCVLLARLAFDVNLTALGYQPVAPVTLDQDRRPFLLSSQFVQEALLSRLLTPSEGGGVTAHSALSGLAVGDDHPQYLPVNGSRAMVGTLNAGQRRISNVRDASQPRDALNLRTARRNFVSGMPGESVYSIAAAGRFNATGARSGPSHNDLRVISRETDGTFVLHFPQYENPDSNNPPRHTYVVRGVAESRNDGVFQVIGFRNEGIQIRSIAATAPTPAPIVRRRPLGFMVEIALVAK